MRIVTPMLGSWTRHVQSFLPAVHGHHVKALADCSFAMAHAQSCQLSLIALHTLSTARVPSSQRRWERLVANDRLRCRDAGGDPGP